MNEVPLGDYAGKFAPALGEVYGYRIWTTGTSGMLRPRNLCYADPWQPGVNQAVCRKDLYEQLNVMNSTTVTLSASSNTYKAVWTALVNASTAVGSIKPQKPKLTDECHTVPDESCRCGFYAYFRRDEPELAYYNASYTVFGAIRGFGQTLIGTRGFRTEKAEIIALLDPLVWRQDHERRHGWYGSTPGDASRMRGLLNYQYPDVPVVSSYNALSEFVPTEDA